MSQSEYHAKKVKMVSHQIYKVCLEISQVKHILCDKIGTHSP